MPRFLPKSLTTYDRWQASKIKWGQRKIVDNIRNILFFKPNDLTFYGEFFCIHSAHFNAKKHHAKMQLGATLRVKLKNI